MISLLGMATFIALGYALSSARSQIRWRAVLGAFAIQASVGAFVLYVPAGQSVLGAVSRAVANVIGHSQAGIDFLFGHLGAGTDGFVFAFQVLPVIVFFSSLVAVLYYLGIMYWVVRIIGGALHRVLGVSRPEAMSATANIFVGQTEAPLVVRPFIAGMTQSELFAVMVGGMASVAGSVLVAYVALGVEMKFLIAASFMAAPGGLMMAKLLMPEVETPKETLPEGGPEEERPVNVIDAAAAGAGDGMRLALNVGAMLLAFVSIIALANGLLGLLGSLVGMPGLTFQAILGVIFRPVAFLVGVPWAEAQQAGSFIGQKLVVNEFVAYLDFVKSKDSLSATTQACVTFALCGFANFSSIAILLGGLGGMAPNRRHDIARMGLRAVLAASLANFMSAAIAGFFLSL